MVKDGSVWVNHEGELWQCSLEQVRHATSDECRDAEILSAHCDDLREQLSTRGKRHGFSDVAAEGPPSRVGVGWGS
eukprot:1156890-Pyramimonas_sp.AAC.1